MSKREATAALKRLASDVAALVLTIGRERVRLGVMLSEAADYLKVTGGNLPEWAAEQGVDETPPTIYRISNAGRVARVLGDQVGDASVGSLVPLYRVLEAAKTDEDLQAAETLVQTYWNEALKRSAKGKPPTEASVATILAEANASEGTRGKKAAKGSGKGKGGRKGKTVTAPSVPWTETSAADREAVEGALGRIFKPIDPSAHGMVANIMFAAIALAETHSPETVRAVLKGYVKAHRIK
jgi:hypothetical protein